MIRIEAIEVSAHTIPTDGPEADGTLCWDATTIVVVRARAGGATGIGYSYTDKACAHLIRDKLAGLVAGGDAMAVPGHWRTMLEAVRNIGSRGIAAHAISAVDCALWDLKARLLGLPLVSLLGQVGQAVPVYGSGGFTNYPPDRLQHQLADWVAAGIPSVKMKVGTRAAEDRDRVRAARQAIGTDAALFVDANGAYGRKQALAFAEAFAAHGVSWFEEPVSSDDLEGLRLLRDRSPAGMGIAAGEYGYLPAYFRRLLDAGAVDVVQADVTRCLGITGFLQVAALCDIHGVPLSGHTAPALHLHVGCAAPRLVHLEWFHDHVRIEAMLFDGAPAPENGRLRPDLSRPGCGLAFKQQEADRFAV